MTAADWAIIILFVLGLGMIWLEMFLPGGVVGVGGLLTLMAGISLTLLQHGVAAGAATAAVVLVISLFMLRHWMKTFNRSFIGSRMTNTEEVGVDEFISRARDFVGSTGMATTSLQPAGKARFGDEKLDVIAEIGMIEPGTEIEVVRVDGIAIVVRPVTHPKEV